MMNTDDINELRARLSPRPEFILSGTQFQVRTSLIGLAYYPICSDLKLRDYIYELIQELNKAEGRGV
jgi:hypothetical protein